MNTPVTTSRRASLALVCLIACMLTGCMSSARYYLPGHAKAIDRITPSRENPNPELPTVRMRIGETLDVVRPEQSYFPGGYWTSLWVEDNSIVATQHWDWAGKDPPVTSIRALRSGRTKAYYTNRVNIPDDPLHPSWSENLARNMWFWIEVEEGK